MTLHKSPEPIADVFSSATVMFADIAGFTNWSSKRDPVQVFILLERLFYIYDSLATRLGAFKISTIGDCYLAVAGLPEETFDHAEIMAKFAFECIYHFDAAVKGYARALGDSSTLDLRIRIGLHSGPVTAGVLRGLKSRFEIFGDTVNTASRMESTGQPSRVQLSEATAQLLRDIGRDNWLVKNDNLVLAKGKGQMQTYWLACDQMDLPCVLGEEHSPHKYHHCDQDYPSWEMGHSNGTFGDLRNKLSVSQKSFASACSTSCDFPPPPVATDHESSCDDDIFNVHRIECDQTSNGHN